LASIFIALQHDGAQNTPRKTAQANFVKKRRAAPSSQRSPKKNPEQLQSGFKSTPK